MKESFKKVLKWIWWAIAAALLLAVVLTIALVKDPNIQIGKDIAVSVESVAFGFTISMSLSVTVNAQGFSMFGKVVINQGPEPNEESKLRERLTNHLSYVEKVKQHCADLKSHADRHSHGDAISERNQIRELLKDCYAELRPIEEQAANFPTMLEGVKSIKAFYSAVETLLNTLPDDQIHLSIEWKKTRGKEYAAFYYAYEKVIEVKIQIPRPQKNKK